ncbi:MAG: SDR family NAD(P)-dependent oxidoreductase [Planctomycetota bacterium]|nr:SDR family NAD(P)-dependent oxidoreductase [Planctomycetota bacterium]
MKLQGKRAIITGASQGFGLAVARAFVAEGASVAICARAAAQLRQAQGELEKAAGAQAGSLHHNQARVVAVPADISRSGDVDRLVQKTLEGLGGLEILVCNAGVYGPKGAIEQVDWNEWAQAISINLLGTVLCCRAAVPLLKKQKHGKIVLLSGGGATKPMPMLSAYAASKAGVVRFGETLAEETRAFGIDVNSVAPGALNTRLLDEVLAAGPEKVGRKFHEQSVKQKAQGGTPLERGAALCVYLASSASDGITGKLISAVWDPWETLQEHVAELQESDIYTLRRIVPAERGKTWG